MFDLGLILWLQRFSSPPLDWLFLAFTQMGEATFYMILLPFVYWIVNKEWGFRVSVLFLASVVINSLVKDALQWPRPQGPEVRRLVHETSPGFPSGHAQGSTVVWGYLLGRSPRRVWLAVAGLLVFFISLSRLYLGVHYPGDVLGGIAIGLLILWIQARLEAKAWGRDWPLAIQAVLALGVPVAVFLAFPGVSNARPLGYLAGLLVGNLLEWRLVGFRCQAGRWQQLAKLLSGYLVLFGLERVSQGLFPGQGGQFLRYALLALWVTPVAPWLFRRMGWETR